MALANDMTTLLNKLERRLGLTPLIPHLPDYLKKDKWANEVILADSIVTFSRYFPHKFRLVINDETVDKKKENNVVWYYIKDEILMNCKLLGVEDIAWTEVSSANSSLTNGSVGTYYYYPAGFACPEQTLNSIVSMQMNADFASLYNSQIVVDFEYPNRFCLRGLGNANYDLKRFVVNLLVEHKSLNTISPTKMNVFEELAACDLARWLYENLKYYDNLETVYLNLDLKLDRLNSIADGRDNVIEKLEQGWVTAANDNIPYIMSI